MSASVGRASRPERPGGDAFIRGDEARPASATDVATVPLRGPQQLPGAVARGLRLVAGPLGTSDRSRRLGELPFEVRAVVLGRLELGLRGIERGVGIAGLAPRHRLGLAGGAAFRRRIGRRRRLFLRLRLRFRSRSGVRPGGAARLPRPPRAGDRDGFGVGAGPRVGDGVRVGERAVEVDRLEPGALEGSDEQSRADRGAGVRIRHRCLDRGADLVEHRRRRRVSGVRGQVGAGLRECRHDRGALLPELPDRRGVRVGLCLPDRRAQVHGLVEGALVREQVDHPGSGRGLPQATDPGGERPVVLPRRTLSRSALAHEVRGRDEQQSPRHLRELHAPSMPGAPGAATSRGRSRRPGG
ncbi:hypothetical protein Cus16_1215 [Curtobacterium sp. ER1/6]|nr:hypothetical protein Cus16_1215 [Curtobacterium sp. ER1/6]